MEGSENLRHRGVCKTAKSEKSSNDLDSLGGVSSAPRGDTPAQMAAGSARIIRYVLIAFFVSDSVLGTVTSSADYSTRAS